MSNGEGFQQRWEFRRKEDDADSSSSDCSKSGSGDPMDKRLKLVHALVLPENEGSDATKCDQHGKLDHKNDFGSGPAKVPKKDAKLSKKKNTVAPNDKLKISSGGKESKKRKRSVHSREIVMLEDLKVFAGSMIQELSVAREEMSQHMREEARKFASSRLNSGCNKKKGSCKQTKKVQLQKGNELKEKSQKRTRASKKASKKSNAATNDASNSAKAVKGARKCAKIPQSDTRNDIKSLKGNAASDSGKHLQSEALKGENLMPSLRTHMALTTDSDRMASTPYLALPAMMPKSQLQNQSNSVPMNDRVTASILRNNLGSEIETGKLGDTKSSYPAFKADEQFASFPCFMGRSTTGLPVQNCPQAVSSTRIGFPVPLHQTYSESSFREQSDAVGPRRNGCTSKFPGSNPAALPDYVLATNLSSKVQQHGSDVRFVSLSSQNVVKDSQVCMAALRNKQ